MKRFFTIISFLIAAIALAQETGSTDTFPGSAVNDSVYIRPFNPGLLPNNPEKKVSLRMEVGSTFGLNSGGGQLFGIYTAPHISYKMSDRWRLNVGMRIQNTNFINYYSPYNPYFPEFTRVFDNNITHTLLYAESEYYVNPRLMISTKVFKEVSVFNESQINPRALDMNSEGISVGFQYRVTENLHFGAEVGYSKGRNPFNPLYPGSYGFPGRNPYGIQSLAPFD